jgi:hypothetical protein
LKINFKYYQQFSSPAVILEKMKEEIPFFIQKND